MVYNQVPMRFRIFNIYAFTYGFLSINHHEPTCGVLSPFHREVRLRRGR